MKNYFLFFFLLGITSCASPSKLLNDGNHYRAYVVALRKLKAGKNKAQNQQVFNEALAILTEKELQKINQLEASADPNDWSKALQAHRQLQEKYKEGLVYANSANHVTYEALLLREENLQFEIADYYYLKGEEDWERYLENNLKINAQKAYLNFAKIEDYVVNYQGLDSVLNETYAAAIVNIYVEAKTHFVFELSEWEIDRVFDDLETNSGQFIRVHYERDLANIDCSIRIKIQDLEIDTYESSDTERYERRVEDGYDIEVDTAGNEIQIPRYRNVEAFVTTTSYSKRATMEAEVRIDGITKNCTLSDRTLEARQEDRIERQTSQGDERALPSNFRTNNSDELVDDDVLIEALLDDLFYEVRRYYFD